MIVKKIINVTLIRYDVESYARLLNANRLSLSCLELSQSRIKVESAPPWRGGNQRVKEELFLSKKL